VTRAREWLMSDRISCPASDTLARGSPDATSAVWGAAYNPRSEAYSDYAANRRAQAEEAAAELRSRPPELRAAPDTPRGSFGAALQSLIEALSAHWALPEARPPNAALS